MTFRRVLSRLRGLPSTFEQASAGISRVDQRLVVLGDNSAAAFSTIGARQEASARALIDLKSLVDEANRELVALVGHLDAGIQSAVADKLSLELRESSNSAMATISGASHTLTNAVNATEARIIGRLEQVQRQLDHSIAQLAVMVESIAGLEQRSATRDGAIANELNATHNAVLINAQNIAAKLPGPSASSDVEARVAELSAGLSRLDGVAASRHGVLANEVNAILNSVTPQAHAQQALEARVDHLARSIAAARELDTAHNLLMARNSTALISRLQAAATRLVVSQPRACPTLAEQMVLMQRAAPNNFPNWHAAYEAGIAEGQRTSEGNLSHEGHVGAGYFRMFLNIHARGRLLDVGCGPIATPSYLADWPAKALAGIDPQLPFEPHPFPFAQTFAETIPWPDASFETVVIATSLDHVYLLDHAFAEIKRVLVPGGRLLIWTAIFDTTPEYAPRGPQFTPPDPFHLFHPGRNWFYDLFQSEFRLIERMQTVASAEFLAYERRGPVR